MSGIVRSRPVTLVAVLLACALAATGCSKFTGAYSLPLPGGASHGPQVVVTAVFTDVQDLVPDTAVRVNDVAVGEVKNITLDPTDLRAHVELSVNAPVADNLPANAVATLEQTSLLGEKYVALGPPARGSYGRLHDGEILGCSKALAATTPNCVRSTSTSTLPDVEQVFGALSAVLNGGDLQDIQTINTEVTKALSGREQAVRGALNQLNKFVTDLNGQRSQIVNLINQLNRLSTVLVGQTGNIKVALTKLSPGLRVLTKEQPHFIDLLKGLSHFGKVTTRLINASQANTVTNLRNLEPALKHLAAAGSNLPHALEILVTYPFPHNDGPDTPGDFTGLEASVCATASLSSCTQPSATSTPLSAVCSLLGALGLGKLGSTIDGQCPKSTTKVVKNKPTSIKPNHPKASSKHHHPIKKPVKRHHTITVPKLPKVKVSLPPLPLPTPSGGIIGVIKHLGKVVGTKTLAARQ